MKVVVTGANGFIGSHCVRSLVARGHDPVAFVRASSRRTRLSDLREDVEVVEVDLGDGGAVEDAFRRVAPDAVINAAWYAEPGLYLDDTDRNLESLQAGIQVLRSAIAVGVERVVLVGSCLESAVTETDSVYAQAKRCLHALGTAPAVQQRTGVTCAHVFSPYGPREHPGRAVPSVVRALLAGEAVAVGDGAARRDYVHVSDVANGLVVLAETSSGGSVDVCTGTSLPLAEVFTTIADHIGRPELLQWGQADIAANQQFDVSGDPQALEALGWSPRFDLAAGVADTVAWWRAELSLAGGSR